MELKEFIKIALADITNAIKESQSEITNGAIINPIEGKRQGYNFESSSKPVHFDICVSTTETDSSGKGIAARINVVSASIGKCRTDEIESVSKISFEIPVFYPAVFDSED